MVRLKRLKKSTCAALGLAGAALAALGGVLMALNVGAARYAATGTLVLCGGMLLLLATMERGEDKKTRRIRLLVLFFLLVLANLRLPPLDILEVAVLPLLALLYAQKGDGPLVVLLAVAELALAVLRTLAITPLLGAQPLRVVGAVLVCVAVLRFAVLWRLWRRFARAGADAAQQPRTLR